MNKWIYHRDHKPKIIDTKKCDIEDYYADGWADSPADIKDYYAAGSTQDLKQAQLTDTAADSVQPMRPVPIVKPVAPAAAQDPAGKDPVDEDDEEEHQTSAGLLVRFNSDPGSLSPDEFVQLGSAVGVHLLKTWKPQTMINKISEVLNNGGNAKSDN